MLFVVAILIGNVPYINLTAYFYMKEVLGDGNLLSPNYFSTAEIFV
jgi:hypothetical protein